MVITCNRCGDEVDSLFAVCKCYPKKRRLKMHRQRVTRKGDTDFNLTCNDNRLKSFFGLKDYLTELVVYKLDELLTPLRTETLTDKEAQEINLD